MGGLSKPDASGIIEKVVETSEQQLTIMRAIAEDTFAHAKPIVIGVNGSVARRECTSGSDVDLFSFGLEESTEHLIRASTDLPDPAYKARESRCRP